MHMQLFCIVRVEFADLEGDERARGRSGLAARGTRWKYFCGDASRRTPERVYAVSMNGAPGGRQQCGAAPQKRGPASSFRAPQQHPSTTGTIFPQADDAAPNGQVLEESAVTSQLKTSKAPFQIECCAASVIFEVSGM